jgi:hypothetical protein
VTVVVIASHRSACPVCSGRPDGFELRNLPPTPPARARTSCLHCAAGIPVVLIPTRQDRKRVG